MSNSFNFSELKTAIDSNQAPSNEDGSRRTKYVIKPTSKRLILDRRHLTTQANEGTTVTVAAGANQTVNIYLSGNVYVDCWTMILRGELLLTYPAGYTAGNLLPQYVLDNTVGAYSLIDRIAVKSADGQTIEEIEDPALLTKILHMSSLPRDNLETTASSWMGNPGKLGNKQNVVVPQSANNVAQAQAPYDPVTNTVSFAIAASGAGGTANNLGVVTYDSNVAPAHPSGVVDHIQELINTTARTTELQYLAGQNCNFVAAVPFELHLPVLLPFFQILQYLPMRPLQRLNLEIRFAQPQSIFTQVQGGNNNRLLIAPPGYTISNLRLDYQTVRMHDLLNAAIEKKVASEGLKIDWRSYARSYQAVTTAQAVVPINKSCADALSIFTVIQEAAQRTSGGSAIVNLHAADFHGARLAGAPLEFCTGTARAALNFHGYNTTNVNYYNSPNWYYQIGPDKIPDSQVEDFPRAFRYLQEALGRFGDSNYAVMDLDMFSDRFFCMAVNLEVDEYSLSGMSYTGRTLYLGNTLTLYLENLASSAGANPNIIVTSFLLYSKLLIIKENSVEIQE